MNTFKRAYPFEESFLPSKKIHVRQKQVDTGISNEERMKEVYDKTLSLLKEGTRAFSKILNDSQEFETLELSPNRPSFVCETKPKKNFKQMVLNNQLQLEKTDKIIKNTEIELCECFNVISQGVMKKCGFCDQTLCLSCTFECIACLEPFCQNCSLPVYDAEDNRKCISCYK